MLPALYTTTHYPPSDFDLRATHARILLPSALASVSLGFVLVRVRVRKARHFGPLSSLLWTHGHVCLIRLPSCIGLSPSISFLCLVFSAR